MKWSLPVLMLLASIGLSNTAVANDELRKLTDLVNKGLMEEAYALSQELLDDFEGDPDFDLQYGIAAIDSGHLELGIFALERVQEQNPNSAVASLELARGYYLAKDIERAKEIFQSVLALNPPASVVAKIQHFLALIEQYLAATNNPWRMSGSIGLVTGYDNNINSSPFSQTSVVTLSDEALGRGDTFTDYSLTGSVEYLSSDTHNWFASGSFTGREYPDENQQNYNSVSGKGGSRWIFGDHRFELAVSAQNFFLDDDAYQSSLGINADWSYALDKTSLLTTSVGITNLDYDTIEYKNSRQSTLTFSGIKVLELNWSPILFAGLFVGREEPDTHSILADAGVDKRFSGGNIGVIVQPVTDIQVTGSIVTQNSRYQGNDFLYGIKRSDDYYSLSLSAAWNLSTAWSLTSGYSYTRNDSNIELYDYDRKQIKLGVLYQF